MCRYGGLLFALRFVDLGFGGFCFRSGSIGCGGCLFPARVDQPAFDSGDFSAQLAVTFRLLGLSPEIGGALLHVAENIVEAGQIFLRRAQFLFGILPPDMKAGNARRFFQHFPSCFGLGGNDIGYLALTDQRGAVRAGGGVGKDQRDILGPDIGAVGTIGRTGTAFDPPDDLEVAVIVADVQRRNVIGFAFRGQRDFGKLPFGPVLGSGENHIFHAGAAHRLGAIFAHHPANGFEQIRFAATIGANHAGQPFFDAQLGRIDKAFEARKSELLYLHEINPVQIISVSSFKSRPLLRLVQCLPGTGFLQFRFNRGPVGAVDFLSV